MTNELAARLWGFILARGVAALAVGGYVLSRGQATAGSLTRAAAAYWLLDGLIMLWAGLFNARLASRKALLLVRGVLGIAAGVTIFWVPVQSALGQWRPGQLLMFVLTAALVLAAIGVQIILAATIEVAIALEVRQQIQGEWAMFLAVALSVLFGALAFVNFGGVEADLGRVFGLVGLVAGIGLVIGAMRVRAVA